MKQCFVQIDNIKLGRFILLRTARSSYINLHRFVFARKFDFLHSLAYFF